MSIVSLLTASKSSATLLRIQSQPQVHQCLRWISSSSKISPLAGTLFSSSSFANPLLSSTPSSPQAHGSAANSSPSSPAISTSPTIPASLAQWQAQAQGQSGHQSSYPGLSSSLWQEPLSSSDHQRNRLFSSYVDEQISQYARMQQTTVTLKQLLAIGSSTDSLLRNGQFLYRELPVRLAKRVRELESLPYGLSQTHPVLRVKSWYVQSFRDILTLNEPTTSNEDQQFAAVLERILERHANVVPTIAAGVLHLKKELGGERGDIVTQCPFLQDFLNRFYASRIGIRLLIAQHVALHHPRSGWIGCVATDMNPVHVAEEAATDATNICEREYGSAPEIKIISNGITGGVTFIPAHFHHILFELLKNSLRAIVETSKEPRIDLPPVELVISSMDGNEFAVRINDQGGGIPRKDMNRLWTYMHTTAKKPVQELLTANGDLLSPMVSGGSYGSHGANTGQAPMAGFGYGLPLSRLTARYFGGDLNLVSTDRHGTAAYLYLSKLDDANNVID